MLSPEQVAEALDYATSVGDTPTAEPGCEWFCTGSTARIAVVNFLPPRQNGPAPTVSTFNVPIRARGKRTAMGTDRECGATNTSLSMHLGALDDGTAPGSALSSCRWDNSGSLIA